MSVWFEGEKSKRGRVRGVYQISRYFFCQFSSAKNIQKKLVHWLEVKGQSPSLVVLSCSVHVKQGRAARSFPQAIQELHSTVFIFESAESKGRSNLVHMMSFS